MEKQNLEIRSVNPKTLSLSELRSINEVTQDMWAYGIGEFAQCECCGEMISKKDIFGNLSKDIYMNTTAKIMEILGINDIKCTKCEGKTKLIYGTENIKNIQERLMESESFLVVCRDKKGEIVGYMDGYIDSLDTIFRRELHYHYSEIGFRIVRERVGEILGDIPPVMMSFSSMGLIEKYMNFFTIFNMLNEFFRTIPEEYTEALGITELDKKNNLYGIYKTIGSRSLGLRNIPELHGKICNTGKEYESDIVVFRDPIIQAKERFSAGIREFLRQYREVLT
ncbi:hypothetical protein GW819_04010 [Candidatus Gracilibacteria bacterium]|nr:hypothetical protein [Candidatus Gracilibacteria bacterium]PIZ02026.1 MAG: hypothetical protein COY60_00520 [Candidatus Gracilibacteria bacterium CG_4_10_14_0_8_um_filter_38_28]